MDLFSIPDQIITLPLLVTVITVFFILLMLVALLSISIRFYEERKKKIIDAKKEKALPAIYAFLEGERSIKYISNYIQKGKYNAKAYQEVLSDLVQDLSGSYDEKLHELLLVEPLYQYHKKGLSSFFTDRILKSLYYYRRFNSDEHLEVKKIKKLTHHRNAEVAHVAGNALMGSENIKARTEALTTLAKREDHSELAFLELLHSFHREDLQQLSEEEETIKTLLQTDDIAVEKKVMAIKTMPSFGYISSAGFLHQYLEQILQKNTSSRLIEPLVIVLGLFYHTESALQIRTLAKQSNLPGVRGACAFALSKFGSEENLDVILSLLKDVNARVRFEAASALIDMGDENYEKVWTMRDRGEIKEDHIFFSLLQEEEERKLYQTV